jgi:DNA mismatch repair ATPase MutS
MTQDSNISQGQNAAEHVAEAHRILSSMRQSLEKHPDLEKAIAKLEMALSILTTKTAGML